MLVSGLCIGIQFQGASGGAPDLTPLTVDSTLITVDDTTITVDATIQ